MLDLAVILKDKLPEPVLVQCFELPRLLTCLTLIGDRAAGKLLARKFSRDVMSIGCRTGPAIFVSFAVCLHVLESKDNNHSKSGDDDRQRRS